MGAFKPSYSGIGELLVSPMMQAEMRRRAERMKEFAEADAPYDASDKDGDHYRDHFSIESGVQHRKTDRAYGRLVNDSEIAFLVEFGSKHNDAHHTLTRSLDAAKD